MAIESIDWKKRAEELSNDNDALKHVLIDKTVKLTTTHNFLNTILLLKNEKTVPVEMYETEDDEYDFDEPDAPSAQEQYFHMNYIGCL
jgi:hypothetical protein